MTGEHEMTAAKRKRMIRTYGTCPPGWTNNDLERVLDVIYGLYAHVATTAELRQVIVSDPFDRSDAPRQMRIIDLADWLEALVSS
jgi:hypothetical protein